MFLSQQQKETKTVSFIVYDYFSGVKSLSVTVGGNTYTIYVDEENSFSWGDVEATSFAYLDASKSGELYRGISVKMTVSEAGNYQVSVSDYGDLESFVYVNVGGMDVDAPEIPNMVIENAVHNAKPATPTRRTQVTVSAFCGSLPKTKKLDKPKLPIPTKSNVRKATRGPSFLRLPKSIPANTYPSKAASTAISI